MDREWLNKLIENTDIVSLIGKYVNLNRKGRNYWACCPFHHEKTPSFNVDEYRKFYHCFGCGVSGNAINFLQEIENIDFIDAVKILAEEAKMEIPDTKKDSTAINIKLKKEKILKINMLAKDYYKGNLFSEAGKQAYNYLIKRGLSEKIIRDFELGYSIDYQKLISYMREKNISPEDLKEAGLAERNERGYYDVFGGRIIVPIYNNLDEVIAFGGRILQNADFAKYRNTGNNLVFDKSKTLFAINVLKRLKRQQNIDYVILCEGYMDVIALHEAGFNTSVASMGTSLTKEQCKAIKRYTSKVYISYDGDSAGKKATLRGLDMLEEEGLEVRVIELPDGKDPDDVIRQGGSALYKSYIDKALPLMSYKLNVLEKEYDTTTIEGKSKFAIRAVQEAKKNPDAITVEAALKLIAERTGFTLDSLKAQAGGAAFSSGIQQSLVQEKRDNSQEKAIKYLLWAIINRKDYVLYDIPYEKIFTDDLHKRLYNYAIDKGNIKSIYQDFDKSEHNRIGELISYGDEMSFADEKTEKAYYFAYYYDAKVKHYESELKEYTKLFNAAISDAEKRDYLGKIKDYTEKIKQAKAKGV